MMEISGYIFLFRYTEENLGNDNEGVVSDENGNGEIEEKENTLTAVRESSPQKRKKLRVSVAFILTE
jgi:hypothetical protein